MNAQQAMDWLQASPETRRVADLDDEFWTYFQADEEYVCSGGGCTGELRDDWGPFTPYEKVEVPA